MKLGCGAAFLCSWVLWPALLEGAPYVYVITVGNNAVPMSNPEAVQELRYADDDAARFHKLYAQFADEAELFTVFDHDSAERFKGLAGLARAPTLKGLRGALARVRKKAEALAARGQALELFFFFSGHGVRAEEASGRLAFLDGGLTQGMLYDEILSLPTRLTHLIIDACHANTIVGARGHAEAQTVTVDDADVAFWAAKAPLRRFPNVGVMLATTAGQEAYEWDTYQSGVFSHEVISGLRGAADVNGDGRVEYSELQAFVVAANMGITHRRARPKVIARPPPVDRRRPLMVRGRLRRAAWLVGPTELSHVHVEDEHGTRILDAHPEPQQAIRLGVPAGQKLYVRTQDQQTVIELERGSEHRLDRLSFTPVDLKARGALSASMARGLFKTPFGARYYLGFMGRSNEPVVPLTLDLPKSTEAPHRPSAAPAWISWSVAGVALAGGLVFGGLALEAQGRFNSASFQADAHRAREDHRRYVLGGLSLAGVGLVGVLVGAFLYPWPEAARE